MSSRIRFALVLATVVGWTAIALGADLYWCPVCGGNTHHYGGHPHFKRRTVTPRTVRPSVSPSVSPSSPQPTRAEREAYGLALEVEKLFERLNTRNYRGAEEIGLLKDARQKLERIRELDAGQPDPTGELQRLDVAIRDWERRERDRKNMERLTIRQGQAIAALQEQADAEASDALRRTMNRLEEEVRLESIGACGAVKGEVWAVDRRGRPARRLNPGKVIFSYDRITTGPHGSLQMMLRDQTVFTVGPNSEMLIDEFVYDPSRPHNNRIVAELTKGVFRFVSGKVEKKKPSEMKVKLPTGALGIRGTDFLVSLNPDQSFITAVFDGEIVYEPDSGGRAASVKAGQFLSVPANSNPGRVRNLEELGRSTSTNLFVALVSPQGLHPVLGLLKIALFILGVAAMFCWVWAKQLRDGKSMAIGFVAGVLLFSGAYLITQVFSN